MGGAFWVDAFLATRNRTRWAVHAIASQLQVGMSEVEARALARRTIASLGMRGGWHRAIVRMGANTTKDFAERSEPDTVLGPDDLFFVDIGPLYRGYEGDAGDTFVVGNDSDHHRVKREVRVIWDKVRLHWFEHRATGTELYAFAAEAARELSWVLSFDLTGHRLSEYPHSIHYDGSIAEVPVELGSGCWVLEIVIAHPDLPFGAFYEDLLLEDQSFPSWVFTADAPPDDRAAWALG